MASRGSEAQRLCKRDQPINAYIVWVIGSKTPCEKEMLTEKLQIDTEMEMLARGTSLVWVLEMTVGWFRG